MNTKRRQFVLASGVIALAFLPQASSLAAESALKNETYRLPNGLTVILHEDHSLPQATINLWYRVGALNEPAGRSGFAHLFEHLMFMGTQRVPAFDKVMEAKGGSNNATTALERTNYFSSGPASMLPTLLWLDADRMEALGPSIDQKKLDLQRDVVRNELRQTIENAPYGKAQQAVFTLMYPLGHPYHDGVIGTHKDLEAATVSNVHEFFKTFYVPSNCSLVVAGDFDPTAVKPLIEKLYGSLPAGVTPERKMPPVVKLAEVKRAKFFDKVPQPQLRVVYHSPGYYEPGDAELDLAAAILGNGPSSRLYKRFVMEERLATEVVAFQASAAGTSMFNFIITAVPGADLRKIEKELDEEIAKFQKEGPTAEELSQRKAGIEMQKVALLESLAARADKLNEYQFYLGTPDGLEKDVARYRDATVAGVKEWAGKVMTAGSRVVVDVLPEVKEARAATREMLKDGGNAGGEPAPAAAGKAAVEVAPPLKLAPSGRDGQPEDFVTKAFVPPVPEVVVLSSGVRVQVWKKAGLPLVSMAMVGRGEGDTIEKAGVGQLMATMTQQGAGGLDAAAFAEAVERLGAEIGAAASLESVDVSMKVLKRNLEPAAKLWAESVLRPAMKEEDFARERDLQVAAIEQEMEDPESTARRVSNRQYFGKGSRRGLPASGTLATVKGLSLDDVKARHAGLKQAANVTILVAGDVTAEEAKAVLEPLFGMAFGAMGGNKAMQDAGITVQGWVESSRQMVKKQQVYVVDRPGATQTAISFMSSGVQYADEGRVAREIVNGVLGGSFSSRLNQNLREVHGYTYGAGSRPYFLKDEGWFRASTAVRMDVTGAALKELLGELNRIGKGDISPAELAGAKAIARNDLIEAYGSIGLILGTAKKLLIVGAEPESRAKDLAAIDAATLEKVQEMAKSMVDVDSGVLVLVGDKEKVLPQLKDLGLPPVVEVDALGEMKK